MWYLIFSIFTNRLNGVKYFTLISMAIIYIFLGPVGSDEITYQNYFLNNCKEFRLYGEIEPFFQIYNMIFGILGLCDNGAEISLTIFYIMFIILTQISLRRYMNSEDLYYVLIILTFYVVTYQLVHNYRTGMATMLAILAFINFASHRKLALIFAVAAVGFHIQVLPVLFVYVVYHAPRRLKFVLILIIPVLIWVTQEFLFLFVIRQAISYFENLSGIYRLSVIPYLMIYIFVIISIDRVKIPNMKVIYLFGLITNIIFIFNAHLSSRLSRVVEPLLMVGLYFALDKLKTKYSKKLKLLITLVPGLVFFVLDRNLIS